jgi:hypothetical protein
VIIALSFLKLLFFVVRDSLVAVEKLLFLSDKGHYQFQTKHGESVKATHCILTKSLLRLGS